MSALINPLLFTLDEYFALERASERRFEFRNGETRATHRIDGTETFDVLGERRPGATLTLVIHRKDGARVEVPVTCRLDSDEDVEVYEAGGVLQRFAQDFLAARKVA